MESIEQALKTIVDREMFNQDYLETLPTNEEAKEEAKEEAITEARKHCVS
jgi:hypothetical protein